MFGGGTAARRVVTAARVPRDYQRTMVAAALAQFRDFRSTLAVMATGTGKTFTAATVIADWLDRDRGSVLWLNERDNLVSQVRGELAEMLGCDVSIEQADRKAPSHVRVVVGSLQSMAQPNRLATFARDRFTLIVCDEAHHSVCDSYRRIIGHFSHAKVLGLTATPQRLDGKAMQLVYEQQCADYRMGQAINDGWLVRVRTLPGRQRLDLAKLKRQGGADFTDDAIAGLITPEVLHGMVSDVHQLHEGRRGVSYWPRVEIAHVAAKVMNTLNPGSARAVDGGMDRDEQNQVLSAHKRGDYIHLFNCGVVVEGYDDKGIAYVYQGRPTKSISRHIQEMGRGTRPVAPVDQYATADERRAAIAASSKPDVLVLDAVGNYGKHDVASPVDALAGSLDDEPTKKRAREILDEQGGGDVEGALEQARRLSERERQAEADRVRRVQAARFEWGRAIDPFAAFGLAPQTDVVGKLVAPPSLKMRRYLTDKLGQRLPESLSEADAVRLSKTIRAREKAGLADLGLVRLLSKHGVAAQQMYQATAVRVRQAIEKSRGWTPPQEEIAAIIGKGRHVGEEG